MLQSKLLVFEFLFGMYYLLQLFLPHYFTITSSALGFLIVSLLKYNFEGFRLTYIIFIIIQLILFISNSIFLSIPIAILLFTAINYFPVYKYPTPTGKYRVGYRMIKLDGPKESTSVGVYYPASEQTTDVKYSPSHRAWERFADLLRFYAELTKRSKLPKFLFKMALSFLEHQDLGVNKDAKIAKLDANDKGFPVVMFSHGLSANIHIYSIILKEWASHGFIVFSVDHEEQIHLDVVEGKKYSDYMVQRNAQLNARKSSVRKMLDLASDPGYIHRLFEDVTVTINYEKIFATGHSFGGATAAEFAAEDKRVTGGVVLLDPWFDCTDANVLYRRTDKPLLCIRSVFFDSSKNMKNAIMKHIKDSNPDSKETISGLFKGSDHNSSTDLMILMPREMLLLGKISNLNQVEDQLTAYFLLTGIFLKTVLEYDSKSKSVNMKKGSLKSVVLDKFRSELAESGRKDIFSVD